MAKKALVPPFDGYGAEDALADLNGVSAVLMHMAMSGSSASGDSDALFLLQRTMIIARETLTAELGL